MKIVKPSVEFVDVLDGDTILRKIEFCGRTCYKSEGDGTIEGAKKFVQGLIQRGHESVLEHVNITVKIVCDRGVSHELVRHRLASYSQESTRYCDYSKDKFGGELAFIEPATVNPDTDPTWYNAMTTVKDYYLALLGHGAKPEEARAVLPNSLKTEVIMTANLREWRHILELRISKAAHPDMRRVMLMLLEKFKAAIPVVFDDILTEDEREKRFQKILARARKYVAGGGCMDKKVTDAPVIDLTKDEMDTIKKHLWDAGQSTFKKEPPIPPEPPCFPVPCHTDKALTIKEWFAKIDEELNEMKDAVLGVYTLNEKASGRDGKIITEIAIEAADVKTAVTSFEEAMGIDGEIRIHVQDMVNRKNKARGYW